MMVFFCTPFESVEILTNFSIVKLVSVILIAFTLVTRKNIFVIREPFLILLLTYTVLTFLSFLWSINQQVTLQKSLMTILPNFIVTLIVYFTINSREDLEKMFLAYILGCCIVAIISLYLYTTDFQSFEGEEGRVTALNQDQNELSFLLSFGIVSIIYLLKYSMKNNKAKSLLLLMAIVFSFVILTTGSRMGLLLLFMIATILIFMNMKSGRVVLFVPLFFVAGIIFYELLPDTTTDRLFQIKDQLTNLDLTGRVTIWKLGLSEFEAKNAYVQGTGYDTFQYLVSAKTGWSPSSHNTYLCTFIETGAIGLFIFFSMIIYLCVKVYYLYKNGSVFFVLLIFPLLATMFVLSTNNRRWFFLIGVIIIKLWKFAREEVSYVNNFNDHQDN
jgi:O-antigen ligase